MNATANHVSSVKSDRSILKPNNEYKNEAIKVTASILFFAIIYLTLVFLAVVLAGFVSFIGIRIILFKPIFITIMLGFGLIGLGLMVIFFLIKFIFTSRKIDRSGYREIKREEFPELFGYIENIAAETKTPFPKKIYLSQDVNASVFYDSSFLSMFFPVRKNLLIGLGFVNSVNLSEFKAVIAHEFGHFSQHSMRLGSYVFNTNKIIYNMLYENDGYAKTLDSWAEASGYFAIFARLTVKIVELIQFVLKKVYIIVNKSNMSLSRQMEHHADSVSAFVSGPNHIISALKRLEIGDNCYQILISKYESWIPESYKPDNLFEHHRELLRHFAEELGYGTENGLPRPESNNKYSQKSRIVFKDQWSSHPSTDEREKYLKNLPFVAMETYHESPWILFGNTEKISREMTQSLFAQVKYKDEPIIMNLEIFTEKYYSNFQKFSFNKKYNGFYDNRRIYNPGLNELQHEPAPHSHFDELFREENIVVPRQLEAVSTDIHLLKSFENSDIKTFDFEGNKYRKADIPNILKQLETENENLKKQLELLDTEILRFFISRCKDCDREKVLELYSRYFTISKESEEALEQYNKLYITLNPIYSSRLPYEESRRIIYDVKEIERNIKQHFLQLLPELIDEKYLEDQKAEKVKKYLFQEREYLDIHGFNETELNVLHEAMDIYATALFEREFTAKKNVLEKQLEIL
jgi:Zn-dependent protease with chaperone function